MTMLAKTTETRALTLADYEARIHLYKEQIGTGYIGIGRTLLEAKEAKAVPHGQWEAWVTETTGLTARQAQRCMQAATEIKDGTAMARLEMSKALLLLSSGLDAEQQEEIAEKAGQEGATVKALREEIRQAKVKLVQETGAATEMRMQLEQTRRERDDLANQMKAQIGAYQTRMDEETEKAYKEGMKEGRDNAAGIAAQDLAKKDAEIRQLQKNLDMSRRNYERAVDNLEHAKDLARKEVENEYNNALENENQRNAHLADRLREARKEAEEEVGEELATLKRNQADLLQAAEEAEKRAADAEAELEALRAGKDPEKAPAAMVLARAVSTFLGDCELMLWYPADLQADQGPILNSVAMLEDWCGRMRAAMETTVEVEGAVE